MNKYLPELIFVAGIGQLSVLVSSAMVPFRLKWREEFQSLSPLTSQLCWVYAGYIVLSIAGLSLISIFNAEELVSGTGLARAVCGYFAVFWGVRLLLQGVLDVKEQLPTWWMKLGYGMLTVPFAYFTAVYGWAAIRPLG